MGIIPVAALGVAASYAAAPDAREALSAPWPVACATVLAVLAVVGLRIVGAGGGGEALPCSAPALRLRRRLIEWSPGRAVARALLPRLPQRVPHTRTPRPALAPAVAGSGLLRGPPGSDLPSRQLGSGGGVLPC